MIKRFQILVLALICLFQLLAGSCKTQSERQKNTDQPAQKYSQTELPKQKVMKIDDMDIYYYDFNPQEKENVLFYIHGWAGNSYESSFLHRHFPESPRIIAPDMPGTNKSTAFKTLESINQFCHIIQKMADKLELESFILCGHSMGGQIAIHFTKQWPEYVEKLILIAPYGLKGEINPLFEQVSSMQAIIEAGLKIGIGRNPVAAPFIDEIMKILVFHDPKSIDQDFRAYVFESLIQNKGYLALIQITLKIIGNFPVNDLLKDIHHQTLIIWGNNDLVLDYKFSNYYKNNLPNCILIPIKDSGHMPQIEQHQNTARAIQIFLSR